MFYVLSVLKLGDEYGSQVFRLASLGEAIMARRCVSLRWIIALGCLFLFASQAAAQEIAQVKPWFLVIVDTSTSMTETGSITQDNTCGFDANPRTKLSHAKCALNRLINGVGDATFGLMEFSQDASCTGVTCGTCTTASCGKMLVNLQEDNQSSILTYIDGSGACGDELIANGYTPLQGSLTLARDYFCQSSPDANPPCGTAPGAGLQRFAHRDRPVRGLPAYVGDSTHRRKRDLLRQR